MRGCGLDHGFGFPSLRGEREAIDGEDDRVAAEHDLDADKVTT